MMHPIYHKDKTEVVHSERCSIVRSLCILRHPIYHKDKTGVVYSKKVQYRPMSLHIAASDIPQGLNKTGVVNSTI